MEQYEEYQKERGLTENDRILSDFEEKVIRLIHHNFEGLTQTEAAKQLNVSQAQVSRAVHHIEEVAPQLFPILTKRQAYIKDCIVEEGLTHKQIATILKISEGTLNSQVATLKAKGVYFEKPKKTVRYKAHHDKDIKHKF